MNTGDIHKKYKLSIVKVFCNKYSALRFVSPFEKFMKLKLHHKDKIQKGLIKLKYNSILFYGGEIRSKSNYLLFVFFLTFKSKEERERYRIKMSDS